MAQRDEPLEWWRSPAFVRLIPWVPLRDAMTPLERWMLRLEKARRDHDTTIDHAESAYRQIVVLAFSSGMTVSDIHAATGTSETTIRKIVRTETGDLNKVKPPPPEKETQT